MRVGFTVLPRSGLDWLVEAQFQGNLAAICVCVSVLTNLLSTTIQTSVYHRLAKMPCGKFTTLVPKLNLVSRNRDADLENECVDTEWGRGGRGECGD